MNKHTPFQKGKKKRPIPLHEIKIRKRAIIFAKWRDQFAPIRTLDQHFVFNTSIVYQGDSHVYL